MKLTSKIANTLNLIHSLTFSRTVNFIKVNLSYYLSAITGRDLHMGLPFSISVEPAAYCNLRCPECPSGSHNLSRPVGDLSVGLFRKTIDDMQKHIMYLTLYFQGEPFLNKDIFQIIKYAKQKNIYTASSTNGHFLNDDSCMQIIDSGLDSLIISLDGMTQETYSQYRIGGNINTVKQGIENLITWKQKLKSQTPYLIIQFLVLKTNENQINQIKEFSEQIGVDELQLKSAQFYDYKNGNPLMPSNPKFSRYIRQDDATYKIRNKLKNRCYRMWSSCVMTWDGKIIPCCFDKDAEFEFGNMKNSDLKSIWNNRDYNKFRKKILQNRKSIDICCNCTEGATGF